MSPTTNLREIIADHWAEFYFSSNPEGGLVLLNCKQIRLIKKNGGLLGTIRK